MLEKFYEDLIFAPLFIKKSGIKNFILLSLRAKSRSDVETGLDFARPDIYMDTSTDSVSIISHSGLDPESQFSMK